MVTHPSNLERERWGATLGLLLLLFTASALAGCRPAEALPTVAAVAVVPSTSSSDNGLLHPPTPPVTVPSPTLAGPAEAVTAEATPTTTAPASLVSVTATPPTTPPAPLPPRTPAPLPSPTPPCATPGRIEHGSVLSAVAGQAMAYRVYLPPCYGQDGRVYPALYLFGGNIHDDGIWDALGIDEAAEAAFGGGQSPPLLIIMPDNGWLANTTTSGPASYEGFVLNELIPHIEATYCAWPAREGRAVGGLSRGGYWSLMMAFRRADVFRSVGAHSPALIDAFAGPAEDPRVTGVVNELGDLRIWIDLGERDPYMAQARPLHDALTADGVGHEWRVNPGIHEYAYWQAHVAEYVGWYAAGFPERGLLPTCG